MADRDIEINFLKQFSSYEDCCPPGVRLPNLEIDEKYYKKLKISTSSSNFDFLSKLCDFSIKSKAIGDFDNYKDYQDRLTYELDILQELGFIDYILLNWDVINFCKENSIPTGPGRGSAAGSLILYLIGVTKVDPIKFDLFFERFVSKSRAKVIRKNNINYLDGSLLADIDNDIAYEHRQKVIEYIETKHPGRTSKILTLNTLSGKLCVKECGKIAGNMSEQDVNFVSDMIPKNFGIVAKLKVAYVESEEFKKFCDDNSKVYKIARKLEGLKKNTGVHPSGIAISHSNITDICPIQKTNDGSIVTAYDMNWVAELMVKFDILGLRTLSAIYSTCKKINLNPEDIDLSSNRIYSHFKDLRTPHGLFQIEADANYMVCKKIKPKNLEELSAVIAIARPGALDFLESYQKYAETGNFQSVNPFFDDVLDYTGGIPLYQEQLMKMAVKVGFTLDEAEQLRRIVGKKKIEQMPAWKKKIEEKIKENKLDPEVGDVLWKVAEDSANYSFNKSHSISYSILAAWTCYLKFNHPQEFFLSLLRMTKYEPSAQEEINKICQDLPYFNIKLLSPDLTLSNMDFSVQGKDIRFGLNSIKGISEKSLSALKEFRDSEKPNKYDIFLSAKSAGLNIGVLSALIQAGALSSYKTNRPRLVLEAQVFNLLTDREKRNFILLGDRYEYDILNAVHDAVTNNIVGDDNRPIMPEKRFNTLKKNYLNYKKIYEKNKRYEDFANWYFEKSLLGFSYSKELRDSFSGENQNLQNSLHFESSELNSKSKYIAVVDDVFCRKSKNGNDYMKLSVSDEYGRYHAIMVDGRDKKLSKFKNKSKIPEKNNIVVIFGQKGEDILFLEDLSIVDEKIYMKLSDLR
jgi:DNA polymerase-3 subunit alpha